MYFNSKIKRCKLCKSEKKIKSLRKSSALKMQMCYFVNYVLHWSKVGSCAFGVFQKTRWTFVYPNVLNMLLQQFYKLKLHCSVSKYFLCKFSQRCSNIQCLKRRQPTHPPWPKWGLVKMILSQSDEYILTLLSWNMKIKPQNSMLTLTCLLLGGPDTLNSNLFCHTWLVTHFAVCWLLILQTFDWY